MNETQKFRGENQWFVNSYERSTSISLPQGVDALFLSPCSLLLLISSTNLGNLTTTDVDGEAPLNFDNITPWMILPSHAQDFPSLYRFMEEACERF